MHLRPRKGEGGSFEVRTPLKAMRMVALKNGRDWIYRATECSQRTEVSLEMGDEVVLKYPAFYRYIEQFLCASSPRCPPLDLLHPYSTVNAKFD